MKRSREEIIPEPTVSKVQKNMITNVTHHNGYQDTIPEREFEKCQSPQAPECGNTNIALYIMHGGDRLPICRKCWSEISESNLEWNGSDVTEDMRRK